MTIQALYPDISPSLSLDFANVKQLDPRVTFARASTARYYDGKTVAKAEENLLIRSQEFDNAVWSKTRSTVTADTTAAPDGTTTADSLLQQVGQTLTGLITQSFSGQSSSYIISVFAKPNGKNFIRLALVDAGSVFRDCYFDVLNGTVGTATNSAVGSIQSSTDGYYRCSIAVTPPSAGTMSVRLFLADSDNSTTVVDDGTGLFIWGAQLEQRSAVTAYTATTTQPITNYIPVLLSTANNEARFDHNPTTSESLGLLIEKQRTNLLLRSEEFDSASWAKSAVAIGINTIVAPDGTLTGDKLVEDTTSSNTHIIDQGSITVVSGTTYSASVYIKAAERTKARVVYLSSASGVFAEFDFLAGTAGAATVFGTATAVSSSIQNVGNGWYRCTVVGSQSVGTSGSVRVELLDASGNRTYTGDGFSGLFLWGAQLEAGAFPTSYIPTVASQVTRSADVQSATNLGQLGQGTFYIDATVRSGNTLITSGATTFSATAGTRQKTAVAYNTTDTRKSINGATVTSTAGTQGGSNITIANGATGHINKIALYPQKLTDNNLQALTT
jgi:hypothetical protein